MLFQTGTFQEAPTFFDMPFAARITGKVIFGARWYYAFTEQVVINQISNSTDTAANPLYMDYPTARQAFTPDVSTSGPYCTEINNRELPLGAIVNVKYKVDSPEGTVFEADGQTPICWVEISSTDTETIQLGRAITDGVLNETTTLTSNSANFGSSDVGSTLIGAGIPTGTTIAGIASATSAVMSAAATASATGVSAVISTGTATGYPANVYYWNGATGDWTEGNTAWLIDANDETPVEDTLYRGWLLGWDAGGVGIWGTALPAASSGSSLAVYNGDTESDAAVTRIDSDANSVLTWSDIASGHVQFVVAAASPTQDGVVATGTQAFSGTKTFFGTVHVSAGVGAFDGLIVDTGDDETPQNTAIVPTGVTTSEVPLGTSGNDGIWSITTGLISSGTAFGLEITRTSGIGTEATVSCALSMNGGAGALTWTGVSGGGGGVSYEDTYPWGPEPYSPGLVFQLSYDNNLPQIILSAASGVIISAPGQAIEFYSSSITVNNGTTGGTGQTGTGGGGDTFVSGICTGLGSGAVTSVTGTAPIASSGGTTPAISFNFSSIAGYNASVQQILGHDASGNLAWYDVESGGSGVTGKTIGSEE